MFVILSQEIIKKLGFLDSRVIKEDKTLEEQKFFIILLRQLNISG